MIDDVLTVSKLDSGLFSIIPVQIQPVATAERLLKVLEGGLHAASISRQPHVKESLTGLAAKRALLDSRRVLQTPITLITSAIKFTPFAERRNIDINIGATIEKPMNSTRGFEYLLPWKRRKGLAEIEMGQR